MLLFLSQSLILILFLLLTLLPILTSFIQHLFKSHLLPEVTLPLTLLRHREVVSVCICLVDSSSQSAVGEPGRICLGLGWFVLKGPSTKVHFAYRMHIQTNSCMVRSLEDIFVEDLLEHSVLEVVDDTVFAPLQLIFRFSRRIKHIDVEATAFNCGRTFLLAQIHRNDGL